MSLECVFCLLDNDDDDVDDNEEDNNISKENSSFISRIVRYI